jgi:hypothetical protein
MGGWVDVLRKEDEKACMVAKIVLIFSPFALLFYFIR